MSDSSSQTTTTSTSSSSLPLTNLNTALPQHYILNLIISVLSRHQFRVTINDANSNSDISNLKDYVELTLKHEKSAMTFRVKVIMITKAKMQITAYAEEDEDKIYTFTLNVFDYLNGTDADAWRTAFENKDWDALYKNREHFEKELRDYIIKQLVPMGREDLTEDKGTQSISDEQIRQETRTQQPQRDPRGLRDPDFDPLRVGPPRRPLMVGPDPDFFPHGGNIGSSDLYPSGFGPRPFAPPQSNPNGGMLVGPNSNLFGPRGQQPPINPPGVPPGARYDPFGQEPDRDDFPMPGPPQRREPRGPRGGGGLGGGFNPPFM